MVNVLKSGTRTQLVLFVKFGNEIIGKIFFLMLEFNAKLIFSIFEF
jgi:hypothetical protein